MENVLLGEDIDLLKFPVPKWHELDGGRFIGAGCMVIQKDPDTGWVNMGTYRTQVVDKNTVTMTILTCTTALIDACRPWAWRDQFPKTTKTAPEVLEQVRQKWGQALFG